MHLKCRMSKAALTLHVLLKLIDTFLHGNVEQLNKFSVRHVPLELIDTLLHGNAEQLKIISVRQLFFAPTDLIHSSYKPDMRCLGLASLEFVRRRFNVN